MTKKLAMTINCVNSTSIYLLYGRMYAFKSKCQIWKYNDILYDHTISIYKYFEISFLVNIKLEIT